MLAWLLTNAAKRKNPWFAWASQGFVFVRITPYIYIGICRGTLLSVEQPSALVGAFELVA